MAHCHSTPSAGRASAATDPILSPAGYRRLGPSSPLDAVARPASETHFQPIPPCGPTLGPHGTSFGGVQPDPARHSHSFPLMARLPNAPRNGATRQSKRQDTIGELR
jgi:hypothetical protein